MYSFLLKTVNIGITEDLDLYQKREVKTLNILAFVILIGLLVGSTNVFFLNELYPAVVELTIAIFSSFILLLNWSKRYELASYLFVVTMSCTLFFISEYYSEDTDTYLYYFPVTFSIALLYNPNKPKTRTFVFFLIILISFLLTRFIEVEIFKENKFTAEQNRLLFLYNVMFCTVLNIALVYIFIRMINNQYNEISGLLIKSKTDQTVIFNSLHEKEILIKELQHRVKNNMAILIGLFNFQRESSNNEEVKNALTEAKNRVLSIAMVHQHLYGKTDLSKINLKNYISELTDEVVNSHPLYANAQIQKDMEDVTVDITKAIPIGLIINEVYTNSFKHAFKKQGISPEFKIGLHLINQTVHLTLNDNGVGFPETIIKNSNSLGQNLMESLTDQIDGKISFINRSGAMVSLSFPA